MQEVRNAVDQAAREIHQRFDFKNTDTSIELDDETIELHSGTEDRLKAAYQVLQEKIGQARQVPLKALQPGAIEPAAKGSVRQSIKLVTGHLRREGQGDLQVRPPGGPKAQTQIQGAQVRVIEQVEGRPAGRDPRRQGARLRHRAAVHELPLTRRRSRRIACGDRAPGRLRVPQEVILVDLERLKTRAAEIAEEETEEAACHDTRVRSSSYERASK